MPEVITFLVFANPPFPVVPRNKQLGFALVKRVRPFSELVVIPVTPVASIHVAFASARAATVSASCIPEPARTYCGALAAGVL